MTRITKAIYPIGLSKNLSSRSLFHPEEEVSIFRQPNCAPGRLAGRITAKNVIIKHFSNKTGIPLDYLDIIISNKNSGVPTFSFCGGLIGKTHSGNLSISYTKKYAIAAVSDLTDSLVGVDVECISRLSENFGNKFLLQSEIAWVNEGGNEHEYALRRAYLWSTKESYLKALGLGLRKDPRTVVVQNPKLKTGNIIILDNEKEVRCSIFWYMAECDHVIVGLKI